MRGLIVAATALLAGCSHHDAPDNAAPPVVINEMPDLAANAIAAASDAPTATSTPVAAIPPTFEDRWAMVSGECDPAKADIAKGLLTISGGRLGFYESRGVVSHVRGYSAERVGFDLAMSGEGRTWSEPTELRLRDHGETLIRDANGPPGRAGSFTYHRCPA